MILTTQLMTGNEAVARACYEAGVKLVSAYPGTPSTEITENAAKYDEIYAEWAPNEKVALEVAIGASIIGARSLAAMKHVGLNVAADPLFTIAYGGVNGGLVIVSADDPGMHSSQNEQDNRLIGRAAGVPVLEPSDSAEALEFTKTAFSLSERFDMPFIIRLTTRTAHSSSLVSLGERKEKPLIPYKKNEKKFVMMPAHARPRHLDLEERLSSFMAYVEGCGLNRIEWRDKKIGVICSGAVYNYVKEALPCASILKIGVSYPLPARMFKEFAAGVKKLYVIEELEPMMEDFARSLGIKCQGKELFSIAGEIMPWEIASKIGGKEQEMLPAAAEIPARPPVMCAGCPHRGLFYLLGKHKLVVSGDIGCYTLACSPPLSAMDTTICMGASIGVAHGMEKAAGEDTSRHTVAVLGESTFLHSGMTGLLNVVYNQSRVTTIILDNSITAMTGHQHNPASGKNAKGQTAPAVDFEQLCRAIGVKKVLVTDPYDLQATEAALTECLEFDGPAVLITRRPCALLVKELPSAALTVDNKKCTGCKTCLKLGCPALGFNEEGKAFIEQTQCAFCGLCAEICRFDAINKEAAQ